MLGHRLRRWPNIKTALVQCLVIAGRYFGPCVDGCPREDASDNYILYTVLISSSIMLAIIII